MLFIVFSRSLAIAALFMACSWISASYADPISFNVMLSGGEEVPPVQTAGSGLAEIVYDRETRTVKWTINWSALSGPATMAHFHGPASRGEKGGVGIWLSKQGSAVQIPVTGQAILTPEQAEQFTRGRWYVNIHTQANPGGEIRGQVILPER